MCASVFPGDFEVSQKCLCEDSTSIFKWFFQRAPRRDGLCQLVDLLRSSSLGPGVSIDIGSSKCRWCHSGLSRLDCLSRWSVVVFGWTEMWPWFPFVSMLATCRTLRVREVLLLFFSVVQPHGGHCSSLVSTPLVLFLSRVTPRLVL